MLVKTIVVAGGTSFIGLNLVRKLAEDGYSVVTFVRPGSPKLSIIKGFSGDIRCIEMGLHDYARLADYLTTCDCYIPFTWSGTKREERNEKYSNTFSEKMIFESIQDVICRTDCRKIILPGSFSEYGSYSVPITEELPSNPENEYGKAKLRLYERARVFCKSMSMQKLNIKLIEARLFSVYGEEASSEKFLNTLVLKMLKNEDIYLTECEQLWSFCNISDVVEALFLLIRRDVESGIFNIVSQDVRPLIEFIREVYTLSDSNSKLFWGEVPYENGNIPHTVGNVDRLRNATAWKERVLFHCGVKKMIKKYKENKE